MLCYAHRVSGERSEDQPPIHDLLARIGALADEVHAATDEITRLRSQIERLQLEVGAAGLSRGAAHGDGGSSDLDDRYYWVFEASMRGNAASVLERLSQYARFAIPLRETLSGAELAAASDLGASEADVDLPEAEAPDPPLWIDLGCGRGEFCELVRGWGWQVEGVDNSPAAVEACRRRGIDATLEDVGSYLERRHGEPAGAISGIQLIEHLPRSSWLGFFERVHAALRPGGALLLETINPLNVDALTSFFVADITHTWPGHPRTLALMAGYAGFDDVDVTFLNPDQRGNPQDVVLWAVKQ